MKPVLMSWAEVEKAVAALANMVRREFNPDIIVGIARGGLIPAVRLSHLLEDRLMRVIHVKYYEDIDIRKEKPEIWSDVRKLEGRVLVVDDVADTGGTLGVVLDHIKQRTKGEVKVATIAWKPRSSVKPDFYVFEADKWIVFPWEEAPVKKGGKESGQ